MNPGKLWDLPGVLFITESERGIFLPIERRLGCFAEFEYDVMAYHVIAWKEVVLPELKEKEQ